MKYETFKKVILERLSCDIPDPKNISIQPIHKNNGCTLDGLVIMENDYNIAPTLYLNYYYESYQDGSSFQETYERILESYLVNKPTCSIDVSFYTDFENTKSRIAFKLIHFEKNKDLLQDIPYIPFLDLAIVFYCLISIDKNIGNATILVHNSHLSYWDINTEDLFLAAKENAIHNLPPQLHNMNSMLQDLAKERKYPSVILPEDPLYPMFVLSNDRNLFGAACILYDDLLKSYAEKTNSDFYILPSSVHEVILIPTYQNDCLRKFSEMVHEVNETQLSEEEILSDHAYYYSQKENKIIM